MLLVLYAISTLYHSVRGPLLKGILHKRDRSAIYLLIAGSLVAREVACKALSRWS